MPDMYQIIERPVITEKGLEINAQRKYAFIVHKEANKHQIKAAVEALFVQPDGQTVLVTAVNTINVKGRAKRFRTAGRYTQGRTPGYKKALVTLAEGQSLQIFEGV